MLHQQREDKRVRLEKSSCGEAESKSADAFRHGRPHVSHYALFAESEQQRRSILGECDGSACCDACASRAESLVYRRGRDRAIVNIEHGASTTPAKAD
jgi:hypothetical protein